MFTDKRLAEICQEAYQCKSWSKGGVEILFKHGADANVFAFRGTEFNGVDILKDLRACPWWSSELGGWFHKGFLKGAELSLGFIGPLATLSKKPVILTGHSLGGAEAQIVAMFLAKKVGDLKVITFGSPRVGFNRARKLLEGVPVTLYRNGIDIVTEVPTILPWDHVVPLKCLYSPQKDRFGNHRIGEYVQNL